MSPHKPAQARTSPRKGAARRGGADELPLDLPDAKLGRHERAIGRQLIAARKAGRLDTDTDAGLASTLRGLGRALDAAERKADPYGAAQVARVILDTLDRAQLLPGGGETGDTDTLGDLLTLGRAARGGDA